MYKYVQKTLKSGQVRDADDDMQVLAVWLLLNVNAIVFLPMTSDKAASVGQSVSLGVMVPEGISCYTDLR